MSKMTIKITSIEEKYLDQLVEIVIDSYKSERKAIPYLPLEENYEAEIKRYLKDLINNGTGVVAIENNEIIGFLAGYKIEEFWGKCKGIYSPDFGHGVKNKNKKRIYQLLYENAAKKWVEEDYTHHAFTIYAHQKNIIDTFFWLGFGLRCIDAIRKVKFLKNINSEVRVKKITGNKISKLAEIQGELHNYFKNSPIFMPVGKQNPELYLSKWIKNKNRHIWAAYYNDKIVGFIKIEPEGERIITKSKKMMNITGAYVKNNYRKLKIGVTLLNEVQEWLFTNNYSLCGVDYESFNISGSNFWNNFFTPYTYSLVRRIDERVLS